ncbi:MAG: phosphate ABC transporter substrate-binding protein [Sulfobacillus acidophilus]|uniref:Phosphate ABC transporter substrate-binding protein n=1 Tax=Sulfobacillus acidophilus TaxID=53633 RepID=A0A2T2WJA6_9FIRM|nr:MAG: phosphate ABC transporter substrate-binding protein [Sulfobacillus acidophilus]
MTWLMGLIVALACLSSSGVLSVRSQHLTMVGATSALPYLRRAVAGWEAEHPGYTVSVSGGGSVAGLIEVSRGRADIGVSDVRPNQVLTGKVDLQSLALGRLPILFIAHLAVGVRNLSRAQLQRLLMGQSTNWKAVGGTHTPVIVMTRPLASGSLEIVQHEVLRGGRVTPRAIVALSNGAMLAAVQETPGALGFVESGNIPAKVAVLAVDGQVFHPHNAGQWPFYAVPRLYWRPQASASVKSLALYLATREYRPQYGIFDRVS